MIAGNGQDSWKSSFGVCFCWLFWGLDPSQNLAKFTTWLCMLIQLTNISIAIKKFMHTLWPLKNNVQGQGASNINLSLFVCFFDIYKPS